MSYVVMAATHGGGQCWLTVPRLYGHRTFAQRQFAERFESKAHALSAIRTMRRHENCDKIVFTIEAADHSARVPSILAEMGEQA